MNHWILIALVIIAALVGYAGYLHWMLWRRNSTNSQAHTTRPSAAGSVGIIDPAAPGQRTVGAEKAVYLLAEALLDDKLTHTEGCIRISSIAAGLRDYDNFRTEYGVFFRVAEATSHIPILDQWRALSLKQQKAFNLERESIESRYSDAVTEAAHRLRDRHRARIPAH